MNRLSLWLSLDRAEAIVLVIGAIYIGFIIGVAL
jgi:hypothetical protein